MTNFNDPPFDFSHFPVLKTRRLTLREIRPEDAEAIFRMRHNGRVNQFIARPQMQEKQAAVDLVSRTRDAYVEGKGIGWSANLRDGKECIGTCGFNRIEWMNRRAEIGGEMATEYWGKGIAQEAVREILLFGFGEMHLHSVEARIDPGNRGAIAVLKQMGFEQEALLKEYILFKGAYRDMAIFSLLDRNFRG